MDATPWKQQVALVIGVVAGAAIIPPILDLLNQAYGFVGAPGPPREHALPAPQAGLISALAQGVMQHNVDWSLIQIGAAIGVVVIVVDELLRRFRPGTHLSPLAVGLGMYLPTQSTLMVVAGAVAGWVYDRHVGRLPRGEAKKQLGVLLASGMIVGEGLVGRGGGRAGRVLRPGLPAGAGRRCVRRRGGGVARRARVRAGDLPAVPAPGARARARPRLELRPAACAPAGARASSRSRR